MGEIDWKKLEGGSDVRGEMYQMLHSGTECIVYEIKKGQARGGDSHVSIQYDTIIKGVIDYRRMQDEKTEIKKHLVAPQFIVSPAGKPHIFIALEDSLILEWTGLGKFQKELYAPYREIIEARKKGQVIKK